jgi:hypothetical protein
VRSVGRKPTVFGTTVGVVLDHFGVEAGAESMSGQSGWQWPRPDLKFSLGAEEAIVMRGKRSPRDSPKKHHEGRGTARKPRVLTNACQMLSVKPRFGPVKSLECHHECHHLRMRIQPNSLQNALLSLNPMRP